jgi:hypothetical protein
MFSAVTSAVFFVVIAGQIFSAPFTRDTPGTTGFSVAAWVRVTTFYDNSGGAVWERMFSNVDLNIRSGSVTCKINNVLSATWSASVPLNIWRHYMCTYGRCPDLFTFDTDRLFTCVLVLLG